MPSLPVPLDQTASSGSTIVVEEVEASTPGGRPMKVVLQGSGLPKASGASWEAGSRLKTTWYPGNGIEASQQLLGPQEMPAQWTGSWARTMLSRSPCYFYDSSGAKTALIDPIAVHDALDQLRLGGAKLRATWAVRGFESPGQPSKFSSASLSPVDFQVIREGRMSKIGFTPDGDTDFAWSIGWEWTGRGGKQARVASVRGDEDLSKATSAVTSSINAMSDAIEGKVKGFPKVGALPTSLTIGKLEAIANAPLALVQKAEAKIRYNVGQFARAAALAKKIAATPQAIAQSAIDLARNTTAVANQAVDDLGKIPAELQCKDQRVSTVARSARYFASIQDRMDLAARAGSELEHRTRLLVVSGGLRGALSIKDSASTRAGDIIAVHVVKSGETPESVAMKFYASSDRADEILRANRLPGHTPTLRPGSIIVIPALGTRRG